MIRINTSSHEDVTHLEAVAVYNEEKEEVTVFAVNRNTEESVLFEADLRGFENYRVKEYLALENDDLKAVNSADRETVFPVRKTGYQFDNGIFSAEVRPCSWNTIVFGKHRIL